MIEVGLSVEECKVLFKDQTRANEVDCFQTIVVRKQGNRKKEMLCCGWSCCDCDDEGDHSQVLKYLPSYTPARYCLTFVAAWQCLGRMAGGLGHDVEAQKPGVTVYALWETRME
jgi:hypothetical protein